MRKILLIVLFNMLFLFSWASLNPTQSESSQPGELMIPLFNTGKFISVEDFLKLTPRSYREMTGEKMKFKERLGLSFGKKSLKKRGNKDGIVNTGKKQKRGFFGNWQWHWGGFALGFFLSLLGPIIALFFNDDYKWDRFHTALRTALIVFALISIGIAVAGG